MNTTIQKILLEIIQVYQEHGPQWKPGKDLVHLNKRISRRDLPLEFTLVQYNELIITIVSNRVAEIHVYQLDNFNQKYFAFSVNNWIVIIGENKIMETAMVAKSLERYLSQEKGYTYIGTVKEVFA